MTIDLAVIAVRNRLPGERPPAWATRLRALGQEIGRAVLRVHHGRAHDGPVTGDDLVWFGLDEDLAAALVPDPGPDEGFTDLWLRLEALRAAAGAVASPAVLAALGDVQVPPPARVDQLGETLPLFAGEFMTLAELADLVPDPRAALERELGALAEQPAARPGPSAVPELVAAGWTTFGDPGPITAYGHPGHGVVLVVDEDAVPEHAQRELERLAEQGAPYVQRALEQGFRPISAVRHGPGGRFTVDGRRLPPGASMASFLPQPPAAVADLVRSLVGRVHALRAGIEAPAWCTCPSCGGGTVDVARLELDRGISTFKLDAEHGEFRGERGARLRLAGRKAAKPQVVLRLLRCADCQVCRPFPGDEALHLATLPQRMAGDRLPRGVSALLEELTGQRGLLNTQPLAPGIAEWAAVRPFGATAQFPDLRLSWRTAFRLPDALADLGRTVAGRDADTAWREAAGRVGRAQERVLAWELLDAGNPDSQARRLVVLGTNPDAIAEAAEAWFGPVEAWIPVTGDTCWRGRLISGGSELELVLIRDFLGEPGPFLGTEVDYEFLTDILAKATAVVYLGDGSDAWDDEGIHWAADEGRLVAVVAPENQRALANAPDGVPWLDPAAARTDDEVRELVERATDPQARLALREARAVIEGIAQTVRSRELVDHLWTSDLRLLAVEAELTGRAEAWFLVFDHLLERLASEGAGSHVDRRYRASVAARRLAELGFDRGFADGWWRLIEFHERTGVGGPLVRWIQPILREHPDLLLLDRFHAIAARMPDLSTRYTQLLELRSELTNGAPVQPRRQVLEFWWGAAAPATWSREPRSLPDLLSMAPQEIAGSSAVFIGGPSARSGQRLAALITGLGATGTSVVPDPGASTPAVVIEPRSVDLVKLESRVQAGHLTVVVGRDDPARWRGAVDHASVVALTRDLSVPSPPLDVLSRRLPVLAEADLVELGAVMHTVEVPAGADVVTAGHRLGGAAWVRVGRLRAGQELLGVESMVGAAELFDDAPHPEPVVALEPTTLDVLSRSALRRLTDAGRRAVVALQLACARSLAMRAGPGRIEPGWFTPRTLEPRPFDASWSLLWPLARRAPGLDAVEPGDVIRAFGEVEAVTFAGPGVIYEPNAECASLLLVLDGQVQVDDGRTTTTLGPGRFAGRLGLLPDPGQERCTALGKVTVLWLGERADQVWSSDVPGLRLAMIATAAARLRGDPGARAR